VLAYTRRVGPLLVCDRIAHEPPRPYQKKGFAAVAAAQITALFVLGVVYAVAVGAPLAAFFFGPTASPTAPAPPRPQPRRR
jgi:hypothetical protein